MSPINEKLLEQMSDDELAALRHAVKEEQRRRKALAEGLAPARLVYFTTDY